MHTRHPSGSKEAHLRTAWDMVHIKSPPWVAAAPGRARGRASTPRGGAGSGLHRGYGGGLNSPTHQVGRHTPRETSGQVAWGLTQGILVWARQGGMAGR